MSACSFDDFRFSMSRGDDKEFEIFIRDPDTEQPVSVDGWTEFFFTGKHDPSDADVDAQFQLTTAPGEGLTLTDPEAGEVQGRIEPAQTEDLTANTLLYCDFQGIDPTGKVKTIMRGLIDVCVDITVATS